MKTIALSVIALLSFNVFADGDHKHDFHGDVKAFHDVLAPLWHAKADDKRQRDTCAALPNMITMASKMTYASAKALQESGQNLQRLCSADQKTFDASFSQFHDVFHQVMKEQKTK
jgi:hypothetical protein